MAIERIDEQTIELFNGGEISKIPKRPDNASQFEAVLLQSMFKTSCLDQHFIDDYSPFITPNTCELPFVSNRELTSIKPNDMHEVKAIRDIHDDYSLDGFVKSVWPYAQQAASLIGLDPKILMAQIALETGWGQFIANDTDGNSSNNLFNIKANSAEPSVEIKTTEYLTNTPVKMTASFKKYSSIGQGFDDYISLISGERYKTALINAHDPERYVDALHRAGYATDPDYANKILSIYHGEELQHALERTDCC